MVTLNYTETEWLSQQFATRTESVTPFLVSFWQATVKLAPSTDTWTDTARLDAKIIQQEGNFAGVMGRNARVWCRSTDWNGSYTMELMGNKLEWC